jgi:1-acyl-sn-glycerol-3-phosphate acyltransferase
MSDRIVYFLQLLVQVWFRVSLRLHVRGLENIPRTGPVIIASNHVSGYDPFLIGSLMPRVCQYLAKKELFENVFLRLILSFLQAIPVDRYGHSLKGVREIKKALDAGRLVLLFPEGTRSRTGKIGAPKEGVGMLASLAGAVIVPAFIDGLFENRPSLLKRPGVIVTFGKPIYPENFAQAAKGKKERYCRISEEVYRSLVALSGTSQFPP